MKPGINLNQVGTQAALVGGIGSAGDATQTNDRKCFAPVPGEMSSTPGQRAVGRASAQAAAFLGMPMPPDRVASQGGIGGDQNRQCLTDR